MNPIQIALVGVALLVGGGAGYGIAVSRSAKGVAPESTLRDGKPTSQEKSVASAAEERLRGELEKQQALMKKLLTPFSDAFARGEQLKRVIIAKNGEGTSLQKDQWMTEYRKTVSANIGRRIMFSGKVKDVRKPRLEFLGVKGLVVELSLAEGATVKFGVPESMESKVANWKIGRNVALIGSVAGSITQKIDDLDLVLDIFDEVDMDLLNIVSRKETNQ